MSEDNIESPSIKAYTNEELTYCMREVANDIENTKKGNK